MGEEYLVNIFQVAVVVAFFLCWAPFHAQRLMAIYIVNKTPTAVVIYTTLTHISGVTYYVSATINPILYSIMSNKFRQAFKDTLAHCGATRYERSSSLKYNSTLRSNFSSNNNSMRKKRSSESSKPNGNGHQDWRHLAVNGGVRKESTNGALTVFE
ncbi:hypothetical protein JTE90_007840 [Oedothorax gibbosus]|uniref:G-protein coupled receptors family 1 profile domain-containing protein n=1 Tax=Oedothorax gibbosus TaxID=931172 RepID=A0AAV6VJL8_9ARAC|nr:hypothetical protein JTE90_007840 [Oedothorax gibbosus]